MSSAHIYTVAFVGIEAREVDVQVQMASGLPAFTVVGLPDKAVGEARERVRAALSALGLALPPKRITVNLAPADLPKEGSHYDLPIALGLLTAMNVVPADAMAEFSALGELALDGALAPVAGVLNAALAASGEGRGLICPAPCGSEAAWAGDLQVLAPATLLELINHFKGDIRLPTPRPLLPEEPQGGPDLKDIKGQESAKRALEVAAAGGHNLLMMGPPGSGKSMLAARLPGLLPPLDAREALEVSMIASLAGMLQGTIVGRSRPFRSPHHSASMAALVGGGMRAKPGEVSLAHCGVLFLDELPEFARGVLDSLRQPLESGEAVVARANAHVRYPSRIQLVAAMNPCRCGYLGDPELACSKAPRCAQDYQARISGPLLDRIDLQIEVPAVRPQDLALPGPKEGTREAAERVAYARARQADRYAAIGGPDAPRTNADAAGALLDEVVTLDEPARALLAQALERMNLTARGYHRVLRVARTIADLAGTPEVTKDALAEALSYRRPFTPR